MQPAVRILRQSYAVTNIVTWLTFSPDDVAVFVFFTLVIAKTHTSRCMIVTNFIYFALLLKLIPAKLQACLTLKVIILLIHTFSSAIRAGPSI